MSLLQPNNWRLKNTPFVKGNNLNKNGRPKGSHNGSRGIRKTLVKLRRNPVEELIILADLLKANKQYRESVEIWKDLHEENSQFEGLEETAKEEEKLLDKLQNNEPNSRTERSSSKISVAEGTAILSLEASTEENLPSHTEQHGSNLRSQLQQTVGEDNDDGPDSSGNGNT